MVGHFGSFLLPYDLKNTFGVLLDLSWLLGCMIKIVKSHKKIRCLRPIFRKLGAKETFNTQKHKPLDFRLGLSLTYRVAFICE
jgi:hypothetical protein